MEVFINGSKSDYQPTAESTWEQMTAELLKDRINPNHGIVKMMVDGQENFDFMFERKTEVIADSVKVVEFYTKDLASITTDGFLKAGVLIRDMHGEIEKTAALFRQGEVQEGSKRLIGVFEAFKPLITFINTVGQSFGLDFGQIEYDKGHTVRSKIQSFLKTFEELVGSQEKKDFIELADFLEYQLLEDLDGWNQLISTLQAALNKKDPS